MSTQTIPTQAYAQQFCYSTNGGLMGDKLCFHLMGGLKITINGIIQLQFQTRWEEVFLSYLALNPGPHPIDELSQFIWDRGNDETVLESLQVLISKLPGQVQPYLVIKDGQLYFDHSLPLWIDAQELQLRINAMQNGQDSGSFLSLYKGEFLHDVLPGGSWGLEEWVVITRERLRQRTLEACFNIGLQSLKQRMPGHGIPFARRAIEIDPYMESGYQIYMRLLAQSGQVQAALYQYRRCHDMLQEVYNVEPVKETKRIYKDLQTAVASMAPV